MTINFNDVTDTATPTTGAFNIGGNAAVNGTGMNLVSNSQTIGGAGWANIGTATATQNSAVAPDSTTTASTVTGASNIAYNTNNTIFAVFVAPSTLYTFSCFVRFGTATTVSIGFRDNSTGAEFSTATTTASGWTRISVSGTSGASTTSVNLVLGGANGTFFAWGAQANTGSTATAYVATSGAITLGNPSLAVGTALLGVTSTGSLYLQPSGTNAIQAQNTTSTAAGGNARGQNSVDWQTTRGNANQVASSAQSVIGGGQSNISSGFSSAVLSGTGGISTAGYSAVGGGLENAARGAYSAVFGGFRNQANGFHNFIGGGYNNLGTAQAAVTTQAAATNGVTNGSTAVTLAASNASIRVGQLITGTGMVGYPNDTYVTVISGTSLTLSQAANATGTPTLSFFTPHGIVVGGGNNQATGSYSFIGGGGDAGTAANRNVASGDWSFVGGGMSNQATGIGSVVCGGGNDGTNAIGNTASGLLSAVVGGAVNLASGIHAITGGRSNIANGIRSTVWGNDGNARSIRGNFVTAACQNPVSGNGAAQAALLVLGIQTTNATPTVLTTNGAVGDTVNQVILPNNSAYFFRGEVISGRTGGGDAKGWTIEGVIKRGANAAATTLVGVTVMSPFADVGAATWTIAVTADTTNGGLAITFTGQLATTIRTVAQIRTTEMTY